MKNLIESSPVAIGGVGGSGTRVIAEILKELNFYIGNDLNSANDNLWFTLIFKRPKWLAKNMNNPKEIFKGFSIFENAMKGLEIGPSRMMFILKATLDIFLKGHDYLASGNGFWALKRMENLLQAPKVNLSNYQGWGWKEPNTHIYLNFLNDYFKDLKYIHVIRHGLDMAYNKNQAQLYSWSWFYGIELSHQSVFLPKDSLNYWYKSNSRAIELGKSLLGDRFLLVNFENLCSNPEDEIKKILDFLDLGQREINLNKLTSLPKKPQSSGLYRKQNLDIFTEAEIDCVGQLGFTV